MGWSAPKGRRGKAGGAARPSAKKARAVDDVA
jgi:hypothetical protein